MGLFTLDYYFMESAMGSDSAFHPYLGFNVGYGNYEASNLPNANGMLYGGQGGLLFDVTEHIDMDVSYRHSFSNSDALNHIGAVMLGVNYLY
jgi:opacity protein-like surface antigen